MSCIQKVGKLIRASSEEVLFEFWRSQSSLKEGSVGQVVDQNTIDEAFREFKAGVARTVDLKDANTRLDLGLAYIEMGMVLDGLRELATAIEHPKNYTFNRAAEIMFNGKVFSGDFKKLGKIIYSDL